MIRVSLFDEYINRLRSLGPILVLITTLVTIVTYVVLDSRGVMYEVHFSYLVSQEKRPANSDYQFDGYYALQSIELFTETLANWITAPEVINDIYTHSNFISPRTTTAISSVITATQTAPQLVHVIVRHKNREHAEALSKALQQNISQRVTEYQSHGTPAVYFNVLPTKPWVGESQLNIPLITMAVAIGTLGLLVNLVLLWEGLKRL